jgi:hypothetical protein
MTVLGADPDAPERVWNDEIPVFYGSPQVMRLVNQFAYHPPIIMSQRCNERDKSIVGHFISTRLRQGFTVRALEKMVDRFYQMWGADSDTPAYAFVSQKVQDVLSLDLELIQTDPYLEWLLEGMPDRPLFDDSAEVRKAVLLTGSELTHRYPDVVASVIRLQAGYNTTLVMLKAAEHLVHWNLGTGDVDPNIRDLLRRIELPKELASRRRSPASIRNKGETIRQSIGNIPVGKRQREWEGQGSAAEGAARAWDQESVSASCIPMWV